MPTYKTIKVRIRPTLKQKFRIHELFHISEIIYNTFIECKYKLWKEKHIQLGRFGFQALWNRELRFNYDISSEDYSSVAAGGIIADADRAFTHFLRKEANFPVLKSEDNLVRSFYLTKNSTRMHPYDTTHMKIQVLRQIILAERTYMTRDMLDYLLSSRVIYDHGHYYISFMLQNWQDPKVLPYLNKPHSSKGIGIDLGISHLMAYDGLATGYVENPIFDEKYEAITRKIRHLKAICIKKAKANLKKLGLDPDLTIDKVDPSMLPYTYRTHEILKLRKRIAKLMNKQKNIRDDRIKKTCTELVRTLPAYIAIEDLDTEYMIRKTGNKRLIFSSFNYIRRTMIRKATEYNIPVRIISQYYPSSNLCPICGYRLKAKLKLSDRIFNCPSCGWSCERDMNAAMNILNCQQYRIATLSD